MVFQFEEYKILAEDVTQAEDKSLQVAEAAKKQCEEWGVEIKNLGIDVTGALPFGSLMRKVWGDGFLPVIFSSKASESPIADSELASAEEGYYNKAAEIWYCGKPMLRAEQLKGIHPDMASEMVARSFRVVSGKIQIEDKVKMKNRIGRSPDISDAGFIALNTARERFGMEAIETSRGGSESSWSENEFREWAESIQKSRCEYLDFEG
jgi:hypothetical protein